MNEQDKYTLIYLLDQYAQELNDYGYYAYVDIRAETPQLKIE